MNKKSIAKIGMKNRSIPSMSVVKNHNLEYYVDMAFYKYMEGKIPFAK